MVTVGNIRVTILGILDLFHLHITTIQVITQIMVDTDKDTDTDTDMDMAKDTDTDTAKDMDKDTDKAMDKATDMVNVIVMDTNMHLGRVWDRCLVLQCFPSLGT